MANKNKSLQLNSSLKGSLRGLGWLSVIAGVGILAYTLLDSTIFGLWEGIVFFIAGVFGSFIPLGLAEVIERLERIEAKLG